MSPPHAEGQRVRLRPLTANDMVVYRRWQRPDAAWKQFDGPYYAVPDEAEIEQRIARTLAWIEAGYEPDPLRWTAIAQRTDDVLIGTVSRYWISQETHWPALGITLFDEAFWGRGLGREALSMWVDVVFREQPEIVRLDLRTWSGNPRMMRLAERLGFREEARFRKARIVDDTYYDALGYGLLREEWARQ